MRLPRALAAAAVAGLAAAAVVIPASPAAASTFTVTSTADSGLGSLRQAILDANAALGADTITFASGLGTIGVTGSDLVITGPLSIHGPATGTQAITRTAGGILFSVSPAEAGALSFSGLTLSGSGAAQGLYVATSGTPVSTLSLERVTMSAFSSPDSGGAIEVLGTSGAVTIVDSTFTGNTATIEGGAITLGSIGGAVTIRGSTISGNTASAGGGLSLFDIPSFSITRTTITGNTAATVAGGVAVDGLGGAGVISLSTISGNTAGTAGAFENQGAGLWVGAIDAGTSITVDRSTIAGNTLIEGTINPSGGGIHVGDVDGTLLVDSSTISGNVIGPNMSGISIGLCDVSATGTVRVIDSTIDETSADPVTAIQSCSNDGTVELLYSTLVAPSVLRLGSNTGAVTVTSTIVDATNTAIDALRVDGGSVSATWSLISTGPVAHVVAGPGVTFHVTDPGLAPLASNGGPTQTRLLTATSPARGAGDPAVTGQPTFDQRGSGFPRVIGRIDIGAIEMPAALPATGSEVPWPLIIGGILLVAGGIVAVLAGRRRRPPPGA